MTNEHETQMGGSDTPRLEPRAHEQFYTLTLSEWVCSLLVGCRVEAVEVQNDGMVWILKLDSGKSIYIEPVITSAGCFGMVAGLWPPTAGNPTIKEFFSSRETAGRDAIKTP